MNTADTKASLSPVLDRLLNGESLAENEAYELMHRFAAGELDPHAIDEKLFASYLYEPEVPDPDLIIRTGGESRLSNFLLYQAAYSELFFTDVHFPSFRKVDFLRLLRSYQQRKRRFGR